MIVAIAIVLGIWSTGSCNLWRLQNKSRQMVAVGWRDRLFALLWLPIALYFVGISLPHLTWDMVKRRNRRAVSRQDKIVRLQLVQRRLTEKRKVEQLPRLGKDAPGLQIVSTPQVPGHGSFTIRSPVQRRR